MEILHLARCKNRKQVFGILRRTMLAQQRRKEPSAYSGRQQHLFSHWYDADGERTVKTSGENEAIYVNSEYSGGNTGTARFSLYVSSYLVAGQGGKYTKHIYVGSQRIVSKLGDLASYGADPRRIPYAGNEADGLMVDYKAKYNQQLQSIKDNYKTFDIPYNGEDNDDYVNGQGFCCNDGTPRQHKQGRWHAQGLRAVTSSRMTTTRRCSSTITPTIWEVAAISPTLMAKWHSISSMCRSGKYSSRNATILGIPLTSSMPRSLTRKQVCTTMVRGTMIRG